MQLGAASELGRAPFGFDPAAAFHPVESGQAQSVRRDPLGVQTPTGRLRAINVPLRFLVRQAYRVPEPRIIGGPPWFGTARFDVVATAPADGDTPDLRRERLRALLADRFALVAHSETRPLPIHTLARTRPDSLGPNLRGSTTVCAPGAARMDGGRVACGMFVSQNPASGSLRGGGTPFPDFVRMLGDFVDRPIVDRTGLTGNFDLELQFTADHSAVPGAGPPGGLTVARSPDEITSIFTALQEQLGLHLEAMTGPADVLVIDRAGRPTPDCSFPLAFQPHM